MTIPLFEFQNTSVVYRSQNEPVRAIHSINLCGYAGQTLGIVGESGSVKSTLAKALLMLEPLYEGKIFFQGADITNISPHCMRKMRRKMQLIFQDPDASFNPRRTAGWHLHEVFTIHAPDMSFEEQEHTINQVLSKVQLNQGVKTRYAYELSGGQKQRLAIARALLLSPALIVLDEPLSSLDAALRKSVLSLLSSLQKEHHIGYFFITHDLSTLSTIANTVAVMYRGSLVEIAQVQQLYQQPTHPYTIALLSCIPIPNPILERQRQSLFFPAVRPIAPVGVGCPFAHRCPIVNTPCNTTQPPLTQLSLTHCVACHYPQQASLLNQATK
jgi:oligopeptide/dipeptide ABC transporter ATP-binding protein